MLKIARQSDELSATIQSSPIKVLTVYM